MVVIDASVIYKWFKEEDLTNQALLFYSRQLRGEEDIVLPELVLYEIANALITKTSIELSEVKNFLREFQRANIKIEPIDFNLLNKVVEFAKKYQITVYDATYAVLAQEKSCDLVTADQKFIERVNLPFIKYLGDYPTGKAG